MKTVSLEDVVKDLMHEAEIETLTESQERFVRSVVGQYRERGNQMSKDQERAMRDIYERVMG